MVHVDYNVLLESAIRCKLSYGHIEHTRFITSSEQSGKDCQAYFWNEGTTMFLTFRGTSSLQDILSDLNISQVCIKEPTQFGKIKIHKGFMNQYNSIADEVNEHIRSSIQSQNSQECELKLFITGHSLGGALAQIATAFIGEKFPCLTILCHTFGSPRVGNKAFAKWVSRMASDYVRVVNVNDPVPMIPQLPIWTHCPRTCLVIDDDCCANVKVQDVPWYLRCCTSIADIDISSPIKDHSCDEYIKRVCILGQNYLSAEKKTDLTEC